MTRRVEPQVPERQRAVGGRLAARAAQQRAQAGLELVDVERLDQIVVGAGVEPVDPVAHGVAGGQHQHRDAVALAPQQPAHLETVDVGQTDVEHDRVREAAVDLGQRLGPALGQLHLVTGERQRTAEHVTQGTIVVDHQQSHGLIFVARGRSRERFILRSYPSARSARAGPRPGSR